MWDERYAAKEYFYGTEPNDFLKSVAAQLPAGRTLCLAEGEGRNGVYLAELGHAVTGVDQSAKGLEKARKLAEKRGVHLHTVVRDLGEFPIEPESWDTVAAIFCHLPPALRRTVFQRAVNGLRPGGVFVLEAYRPEQLKFATGGPPSEELMMTLDTLKSDLAGLTFEIGREVERNVVEGTGHHGQAAVVQVLARKPAP